MLTAPVDATSGDRDASAITRGPALIGRRALAFHPSVSDEVAIAGKLAQLRALGIVARDQSPALGGTEIELLEGVALYGDSFAEGSSGGGSESAYTVLRPTLARTLAAAGLPGEVTNHAVWGETSAQTLARWATRPTSRTYSVFWAGRNNSADPAAVIADAAAAVAALLPGQVLILVSVHNRNDGTEGSGSAAHSRIAAINAGLAALANGATVLFVDTRAEAVFAGIIGDTADGAGFETPAAHVARQRGHRLTTFAETPVAELGVQFAASDAAGMGVRLGTVTVHHVGASEA